jgi:uncharacterized protein
LLIDIRKVENMPRPRKWRKVCCMPGSTLYGPLNGFLDDSELIIMSVEEYETIRLIDQEGLNQEECAEKMQVARATVQNIYKAARSKMAESLVNGRMLKIEGGDFKLYNDNERTHGCARCHRNRCAHNNEAQDEPIKEEIK